jgi:hypothetical protein
LLSQQVYLLAIGGQVEEAEEVISQFCDRFLSENEELARQLRAMLDAMLAYVAGDVPGFVRLGGAVQGGLQFQVAVAADKVDDAAAILAEDEADDWERHLILYLAARRAGKDDLAEESLQDAVVLMRKDRKEVRQIGTWLADGCPEKPQWVCECKLLPDDKRIVLAAMGIRYPQHQEVFFSAARRHNYDRRPPYLLLRDILGKGAQ